jgi:hypothetical protein
LEAGVLPGVEDVLEQARVLPGVEDVLEQARGLLQSRL